jgi:hypothetical protein
MHAFQIYAQDVSVTSTAVRCNGGNDGSLIINISFGIPEYTIKLYDRTPAVKQKTLSEIRSNDTVVEFNDLAAKKYYILVIDSKQQRSVAEAVITESDPLTYIGYSVIKYPESSESSDGVLELNVSGGNIPYVFNWGESAGNQKTRIANNLAYGIYSCEINDKNNCGPLRPSILFIEKNQKNQ